MVLNKSIIIFGDGKILITSAIGTNTGTGKIFFDELEEPMEIGTKIKNLNTKELPHPIEFIFEKTESIDALIEALNNCKENMINFKKENKNGN